MVESITYELCQKRELWLVLDFDEPNGYGCSVFYFRLEK